MDFSNLDLRRTGKPPRTTFLMDAKLRESGPKRLAAWKKENFYAQIRDRTALAGSKVYGQVHVFGDGRQRGMLVKGRPYTTARRYEAPRSAQTAIYHVGYALVRLIAPLLASTAEEICQRMKRPGSSHTSLFPEPGEGTTGLSGDPRKRLDNRDRPMKVRRDVLESQEVARQSRFTGASLEARVNLGVNGDLGPLCAGAVLEMCKG